jgi:uncharacterized membrane protein YccC
MATFSRSVSLAIFRAHIENGLSVAVGVGLTGLIAGAALGFDAAIAAATGAVCVSISDRTDPLHWKVRVIALTFLTSALSTALASFVEFSAPAFVAATALIGFTAGLISAYGSWMQSVAMALVLAFVLAMGQHFATPSQAADHLLLFVCGALIYAVYALTTAFLFDDRARRLLLAEAMRAFVEYLRAKAALYNPDSEGPAAFRALIDAHAALADRLQAARNSVLARRSHPMQLKRIDLLIALLDIFETVLSSDADFELLRRSPERDLMWRLHGFIHLLADEVERLTLALRSRRTSAVSDRHEGEAAALEQAVAEARRKAPEDRALFAFLATANKLVLADSYVARLAAAIDRKSPPTALAASLDLSLFRQEAPSGLSVLAQLRLGAPAFRYAIRLSLAMTAGLLLTMALPRFAHANWVLLTIALIMRANYSVTRRRRWDRVTGTLIGCALAVAFINILPAPILLLTIVLAVGISHAYGVVQYRITAIAASILSLLLLHFVDPLLHPQFFERIADTLIGAGLSWVFGYLLPSWERENLPRIVAALLEADTAFAEAALRRAHESAPYRLARKKALDAVAQLSGAVRRLGDEPGTNRRALAALGELLGANYLFASDLSSMPVLVKLRGPDLDAAAADAAIAAARDQVLALLKPGGAAGEAAPLPPRRGFSEMKSNYAMETLARRLNHIVHSAAKVARLAARPAIGEIEA